MHRQGDRGRRNVERALELLCPDPYSQPLMSLSYLSFLSFLLTSLSFIPLLLTSLSSLSPLASFLASASAFFSDSTSPRSLLGPGSANTVSSICSKNWSNDDPGGHAPSQSPPLSLATQCVASLQSGQGRGEWIWVASLQSGQERGEWTRKGGWAEERRGPSRSQCRQCGILPAVLRRESQRVSAGCGVPSSAHVGTPRTSATSAPG